MLSGAGGGAFMRILHVISGIHPEAGGTATTVMGLAPAQQRAGLQVVVASTYRDRSTTLANAATLHAAGVETALIGPTRGPLQWHPSLPMTVARLVAQADVVHVHAVWEEIQHQAALACRRQHKPYAWSPHGMLDPWSLKQRWWKKRLMLELRVRRDLHQATAIHLTTDIEQSLVAKLKLHPPAIVEPLGVELREFVSLPEKGFLRTRYPMLRGRPIMLLLSRIHYVKGLDLLLPAFARLPAKDAMLVLAGPCDAMYERDLRQQATELGIGERLIFTGMLFGRERLAAMVDADLFG
ncbi:MAG TPA: glycosyltransferase, partial [Tepidisphaeraceae bacterium]|nr:glycosyltransferase [Tepidisphaeraceae bacterium]